MKKEQSENNNLKDVLSGKYRDCYLVYNRKSTDEANNQKNSIAYQTAENIRFVTRGFCSVPPLTLAGFCTNGIVSEKHSGFKENNELFISDEGLVQYSIDRPKFLLLVQYLSRGYFKGVVCLCWDRISRNKGDDTVIRKLMRQGVDIRFVHANYDEGSAGELHMDIDGMFAQHHSRVTSEKVTLTIKNSRMLGKCTHRAPIGYLNEGTMDHKPQDPIRAPIIKEMFELYATGDWSLSDIARHAIAQGFTTVPMRRRRTKAEMLSDDIEDIPIEKTSRPVTENHISRILTNQFYTGKTRGPDSGFVESTCHEGLVTEAQFNHVQSLLGKKTVSVHYTEKLDHPLRGIVRCALCRRVYTPYTKKGILYFNARCVKECGNTLKNCNFDFIVGAIRSLIVGLHFTNKELTELDAHTGADIALRDAEREKKSEAINRRKQRVRHDLAYLSDNRLQLLTTGAYTPESIVAQENKLNAEQSELQDQEYVSSQELMELLKEVKILSELVKSVTPVYDLASPHQKEDIVRGIFSELFIAQDTLDYRVKKGFEPFANRISAFSEPLAWLSELYEEREELRLRIELLEQIVNQNDSDEPMGLAA